MADALAGEWVGPMPVEDFILAFLPNPKEKPDFDPKFFNVLEEKEDENEMYGPFINHLITNAPDVMDGFKLVNTSQHDDDANITVSAMKNEPNILCYKTGVVINQDHPTRYEDMELIFEFKTKAVDADPFEDRPGKKKDDNFPFEPQAETRRLCRGHISSYARNWCARQHRTHCFIVWIADPHARIIRIDRSGGIVSRRFDYRQNGNLLLHFFWNFSHGTDRLRGLDDTVTKASPQEAKEARDRLYQWRSNSRSVFKVQVPDPDATTGNTRLFFVWGPLAEPGSVTGRATRGYAAWDPKDRRIVFLKDSWRSTEPGMEKEVDILKDLNAKQCRNVPDLVCGDDLDHTTVTKKYANADWNLGAKEDKFTQCVHTRFVERDVGSHITSDLTTINSRNFLQIVFDAFIAHFDAYTKCGILHRDISTGNILVDEDGRGFLNDWDLSGHANSDASAPGPQVPRMGTWQFMSASLLMDSKKLNTLQDDLESFFWLILFHILRYMRHNQPPENLEKTMSDIFDDSENIVPLGQEAQGGKSKFSLLMGDQPLGSDFAVTDNKALSSFFRHARDELTMWYTHVTRHQRAIANYAFDNDVPLEVAAALGVPLDTKNLAMDDHMGMYKLFADALGSNAQWPVGDFFMERLLTKHGCEDNMDRI